MTILENLKSMWRSQEYKDFNVSLVCHKTTDLGEIKQLNNFLYDRKFGFITLGKSLDGYHFVVAEMLLALDENREYSHNEESVDEWLSKGNRAYFSTCAERIIFANTGKLNDDEKDMFEYDFNCRVAYL